MDLSATSIHTLIQFDACSRCGECSIFCPTGGEAEEKEGRTPRGKMRNLKRIIRTQSNPIRRALANEEKFNALLSEIADDLYNCSICGICEEVCPLSLRTIEMWEELRRSFVDSGLGPLEAHESLVKSIENYDNPWMQPRSKRANWARKVEGVADASKKEVDILYFVGCTASYDPEVNEIAKKLVKIFSLAGIEIGILGKAEKCCGSTLLRLGEIDRAKSLASENVKILRATGAKKIVTACAGCYKTLAQDYPRLTGEELPVSHVMGFLAELIKSNRIALTARGEESVVTYHDPCHLGRHMNEYDWPRDILNAFPGIRFVEMNRSRELSRCCGAGGGLKTINQELVYRIAEKRLDDAEEVGASIIVTSCPFCLQTLTEASRRKGGKIRILDITQLILDHAK